MSKRNTVRAYNSLFTSLDLELNQDPITGARIIQIGAVVGNLETGEILDTLSVYINPNQPLIPFITQLTKITQSDVDSAGTLEEAYDKLKAMHIKNNCFINPVTWGGGDSLELFQELKKYGFDPSGWAFGRRWIDTKTLYCAWRLSHGKQPAGGLSKAMAHLGLKFQGQAHDAKDDALNTFTVFRCLVDKYKETIVS